jgi:GntR family transcriptional regulator/MocR family aminotransferase
MSVEWTGLGPELLLRLDRDAPQPLRVQLEDELRDAIRQGRLAGGERLPSSRALARELGISRGLVSECYAQLQAEGYLTSRGGSATRVAEGLRAVAAESAPARTPERVEIDFLAGVNDLTSFPRNDWSWAVRRACREATSEALGYADARGRPELRSVVAAYQRRVRGAVADPDDVVICAGFAQGLSLVLRALVHAGVRTVAVEDPGDNNDFVLQRARVEVVRVPVDERGIRVDALAATDARAVIVTPAHQAPTGVVLEPQRRQELVAWARERDAVVIEDDNDAEIRYELDPVGTVQGLAPDRVALIGTVSKSLAPGLRLGWIVCPPSLAATIAREKELDDRGSPALDQLALAALLESGRYDRHLRAMRASYARRRTALVDALARHAPAVELHGLAAGFHAVARLPAGADEDAVVAAARERSVGLHGMRQYRMIGAGPPELVLGFGNLTEQAIERGIERVGDLLQG